MKTNWLTREHIENCRAMLHTPMSLDHITVTHLCDMALASLTARRDDVRVALVDLLWQVNQFCEKHGEADFETGRAEQALAAQEDQPTNPYHRADKGLYGPEYQGQKDKLQEQHTFHCATCDQDVTSPCSSVDCRVPERDKWPKNSKYLMGSCTESNCRLCRTPSYERKDGMFHAGISAYDKPQEQSTDDLLSKIRSDIALWKAGTCSAYNVCHSIDAHLNSKEV